MERESGAESSSLEPITAEILNTSRSRIALLIALMLLPWACASFGLFVLQDYRMTMLIYGIVCCILPTLLFRQRPIHFLPIKQNFLLMAGIVAVMNLLILGLFHFTRFGIDYLSFIERADPIHLIFNRQIIEYGLYFVIINPLLEETFWRGFIYEEWKHFVSPTWACLITSFFFGAWHWVIVQDFCSPIWAIILSIAVMIGGFLITRVYDKTGTLGAPVLIHSLGADLPLLIVVFLLLKNWL
jgi:membrane protease YdiL (CAAX protease family)